MEMILLMHNYYKIGRTLPQIMVAVCNMGVNLYCFNFIKQTTDTIIEHDRDTFIKIQIYNAL